MRTRVSGGDGEIVKDLDTHRHASLKCCMIVLALFPRIDSGIMSTVGEAQGESALSLTLDLLQSKPVCPLFRRMLTQNIVHHRCSEL